MSKRRGIFLGLGLVCVTGAGVCGWNLYQELMPRIVAEQGYDQVRAMAFADANMVDGLSEAEAADRLPPDFDALQAWNPDIRGWIWSPDTDIDYPVVQGSDNDYYLNHTTDRKKSIIGSIFMESKNRGDFQDDVTVLYGHHIRGGRMFSSLSGYKEQSYYDAHPELYLYTPEANYRVELFAGQVLSGTTGEFPLIFESEVEGQEWIRKLLNSSTFSGGKEPAGGGRILALCTCSYEYQNARYVVYGVLRELEETAK